MTPSGHLKNPGLFKKVYALVAQIPEGKVATYGQLAKILGLRDVRKVGWALHANKDSNDCPCHRVVNKEGEVSRSYAFGGQDEQKMKLINEGVVFISKYSVDLKKCLWVKDD